MTGKGLAMTGKGPIRDQAHPYAPAKHTHSATFAWIRRETDRLQRMPDDGWGLMGFMIRQLRDASIVPGLPR